MVSQFFLPPVKGLTGSAPHVLGHLRRGSNQFTYQPTPAPQHPLSSPRAHEVLRAVEAPHLNVTATGTEELPMSSKGAGKFTAATLSHPARRPITPRPGADHAPGRGDATSEGILATRPLPAPRPMAPARVSPSWRSEPHWFNDPCNYLG